MTRKPPARRSRRPQRANSLKDVGRLFAIAGTVYDRKDAFLAKIRALNETEGAARSNYQTIQHLNRRFREFGVQMIANDRVLHFHEEWPGAIGPAWLDDGPAGHALRHLKAQGLDRARFGVLPSQ